MKVKLISEMPVVTVAKADGRARRGKRGARKGRHMVRARAERGFGGSTWMATEDTGGYGLAVGYAKTRAGAIRRCRRNAAFRRRVIFAAHDFPLAP